MKKIILVSVLTLLAGTAYAADAVVEPEAAPVAELTPAFVWSGGYVGLQGGYGWTDVDVDVDFDPGFSDSFDANGGFAGLYAGYNFQSGSFVGGIEADINKAWIDETALVGPIEADTELDWFGSIRGRAGFAFDRALVFGTAGVAFASASADVLGESYDLNYTGWTIGGGAEYAVTDNITLRGEYRYYDFGSDDFDVGPVNVEADLRMHAISFGAAYKF